MRRIALVATVASLLALACAQPPAGADTSTVEQEVTDFLAEYLWSADTTPTNR